MVKRSKTTAATLQHAILFSIGLAAATPALASDPERTLMGAQAAYQDGDYRRAYDVFAQLADAGDGKAQLALARMYHTGLGVKTDMDCAKRWYGRAAEQGLAEAQFQLALLYLESIYATEDDETAKQWLLQAAASGHQQAKFVYDNLASAEDLSGC